MSSEKPCNVCTEFKFWTKSEKSKSESNESTSGNNMKSYIESTTSSIETQPQINDKKEPLDCPPDSLELGRSTWTFLHTMASYYPTEPTPSQKDSAIQLISALSELYPCSYCAHHLKQEIQKHPINVENRQSLEKWMCDMHNEVNLRLGKTLFDCSRVGERWRDGKDDCIPPKDYQ